MRLEIFKDVPARVPSTRIRRLFDMITDDEADPGWQASVNLVFTSDRRIRTHNRQYRQRDQVTDVLSFNLETPEPADNTFGEIYISVGAAKRQAASYGGTHSGEFLRLACHGLLHLFGYDHQIETQGRIMRKREQDYLDRLGVRFE